MSAARIVVVGGGSQFAVGLCESLVDYGRDLLAGSEITLLDIREDTLEVVCSFARRLVEATGSKLTFDATTDRRRAFAGADYLLTTFRPGSHAELIEDETVPPRYGLQGNETVGIGGMFMACRVAPVLREICADAQELCPRAWIVNYTNPTQYVADAIGRISDLRVVSLCDGYIDLVHELARLLEVDPSAIGVRVAGTNHAMWALGISVDGEDGYPRLRERIAELGPEAVAERSRPPAMTRMFDMDFTYAEMYKQFVPGGGTPLTIRLFELYGVVPGPSYYWRYLVDQDAVIAEQQSGSYVTMGGFYTKHLQPRMFAGLDERLAASSTELSTPRREGGGGHGDLAVRVIASMANDTGEEFVVNVPNRGAVANLPYDAILELSAIVDGQGAHPFAVGNLPEALVGLQESLVRSQQLAVSAALSGDRSDLLRAIVAHPLVHSLDAAERCMDDLLDRQRRWLPQFAGASSMRAGRGAGPAAPGLSPPRRARVSAPPGGSPGRRRREGCWGRRFRSPPGRTRCRERSSSPGPAGRGRASPRRRSHGACARCSPGRGTCRRRRRSHRRRPSGRGCPGTGPAGVDARGGRVLDGRSDHLELLAADQAAVPRVGVQSGDGDPGFRPGSGERRGERADRVPHALAGDEGGHLPERDVKGRAGRPECAHDAHQHRLGAAGEVTEEGELVGLLDPAEPERLLLERRRDDRLHVAGERELRGRAQARGRGPPGARVDRRPGDLGDP